MRFSQPLGLIKNLKNESQYVRMYVRFKVIVDRKDIPKQLFADLHKIGLGKLAEELEWLWYEEKESFLEKADQKV